MGIIVSFVSQKGGVGKSTLARALACVAANAGWSVRIADLDDQQSTAKEWSVNRQANGHEPDIDVVACRSLSDALKLKDDVDLLIVDGPARATQQTFKIAEVSDLVVQPTGPRIDDMVPGVKVFQSLEAKGIEKHRLVFAMCRVHTITEETRARSWLRDAEFEVLSGHLPERPAYGQAQDVGRAVIETRHGSLNEQADKLIESMLTVLVEAGEGNKKKARVA